MVRCLFKEQKLNVYFAHFRFLTFSALTQGSVHVRQTLYH